MLMGMPVVEARQCRLVSHLGPTCPIGPECSPQTARFGWFCLCAPGGSFSHINDRFPSGEALLDLTLHTELHL